MSDDSRNVPKLRFHGFTDAWTKRELGEVATIYDGPHATPTKTESGPWYLSISSLVNGHLDFSLSAHISEDDLPLWSRRVSPSPGDTLFSYETRIGEAGYWDFDEPAALGRRMGLLRPSESIDPWFLTFVYLGSSFQEVIKEHTIQGGTVERIPIADMSNWLVTIPALAEQGEIVDLMRTLDDLIAANERKCDHLRQLKRGYLQQLFPAPGSTTPRLRCPGFEDPWKQRRLGDLGTAFTGLSGKTKEDFGHGDAEFITYMNVFSNPLATIDGTERVEIDSRQSEVKYGDVLFTTSSETPEEVGMSSVWLGNRENVYLNSFCFGWRPLVGIDPHFFAFMLRSSVVRNKLVFLAQGISRYNISKSKVMEMLIPVPSIEEQRQVGRLFTDLDRIIALHQRKCEHLRQLKRAYLQKMFV
ncbi:MAG: restriction endonuclease subunit S [Propionibacteriaceae bacterium]|jgi:type I restriction enzyme S subunit|nr:restriction endonuclease subunit S [Propionibacteriaceae bacterium]